MSHGPDEWNFLQTAWRFAYVLTGCHEGAAKVFKEAMEEVLRHPHAEEHDRIRDLTFAIVRRRSLKYPARCELGGLPAQLHHQLEPARSALALSSFEVFSEEAIRHLLDTNKKLLSSVLSQARGALQPSGADATPPDKALAAELQALPLSDAALQQIEEMAHALTAKHSGHHTISVKNPAILAVGFGFLLLVGILVWHLLGNAGVFPDEAIKIATLGAKAGPDQFDAVEEKAGNLQDWFMLKGFDGYRVPPGFEGFEAAGVRIFKMEGEPIAQVAVPENLMYFYSFASQPFGINVVPEKSWRITEADRTVLAIREEKGTCFMISFRGRRQDMQRLLEKAGQH